MGLHTSSKKLWTSISLSLKWRSYLSYLPKTSRKVSLMNLDLISKDSFPRQYMASKISAMWHHRSSLRYLAQKG